MSEEPFVHRKDVPRLPLIERLHRVTVERDRYRKALETIRDSCADWSNDDISDQCRAALDLSAVRKEKSA